MSKISVIVPVYKVEKYLARCVDSILAQTFKDYELILVDDGSPDNCPKMCDEYAAKYGFIKVIHKENGGLSDARNFGIDYAMTTESEWITFIDSDDWVHPQYLEFLYNACINNGVDISSCGYKREIKFGEKSWFDIIQSAETVVDEIENFVIGNYRYEQFNITTAWARLYKKSLWQEVRFPIGRIHEDEFTTYRVLFSVNKTAVVKCELYFYFNNNEGIVNSCINIKRLKDITEACFGQVEFFYVNNFKKAFKLFSYGFCSIYKKLYVDNNNKDLRKYLLKNLHYIKWVIDKCSSAEKNRNVILIKKYGYKNWLTGRAERIENFKNDIKIVKKEKGFIYSFFYYIKNFYSSYFGGLNG